MSGPSQIGGGTYKLYVLIQTLRNSSILILTRRDTNINTNTHINMFFWCIFVSALVLMIVLGLKAMNIMRIANETMRTSIRSSINITDIILVPAKKISTN